MLKKSFICLSALCFMSSSVLASPLTDYSEGKTAIDVHFYPSLSYHLTNNNGYDRSPAGTGDNFDWGVTTGLGNKFALQFRQFNPETEVFNGGERVKTKNQEFNVLYQLNEGISAFAGYHQSQFIDYPDSSDKKNTAQIGLTGSTKIADKTHLFGTVGVGSGLTNYEIGVAYNLDPRLEFNLLYRDKKVEDVRYGNIKADADFKGVGYGVTYKF